MSEFWSEVLNASDAETASPEQICLRVILVSTPEEVTRTIHDLQMRRFAEVRFWSPLQPIPETDQVWSIYTKRGIQARE